MARIAILQGDRPNNDSEAFKMYEGLQSIHKDEYELIRYSDLLFSITTDETTITYGYEAKDIAAFDLVYIRDFRGFEYERNGLALYLKKRGVKFLNSDVAEFQHISKLTQYMMFSFEHVAIPNSLYGNIDAIKWGAEKLGYPMVAKSITGSNGNDNFLVKTQAELFAVLDEHKDDKMIVQGAIPNDGDYRHIVLGDAVTFVSHRVSTSGDHRNNVAKGGEKTYRDVDTVPVSHKDLAIRAAKALNREICGVDIMEDLRTHTPVVLEANFNFGIQSLDGNIAAELYGLADYFNEKANS